MMLSNIVLAAILSLAQTNPNIKIEFHEGTLDEDVAQAQRYIGKSYGETTSCIITFDKNNFSKTEQRQKDKRISLDRAKLYDFVLLHEMAHCFDGIPEPAGADSMEWREFLADTFSVSELYSGKILTEKDYVNLIKLRDSHPDPFKINALAASRSFLSLVPLDNSAKRIAAAKQFRKDHFAARTSSGKAE
jgi:hypothetical protein